MSIHKLKEAMGLFRTIDPNIPITAVVVFLEVAADPNIPLTVLRERAGVTQTTMTRALVLFGDRQKHLTTKVIGHDMIELKINHDDRRLKHANLTPKGRIFYNTLKEIMRDGTEGDIT